MKILSALLISITLLSGCAEAYPVDKTVEPICENYQSKCEEIDSLYNEYPQMEYTWKNSTCYYVYHTWESAKSISCEEITEDINRKKQDIEEDIVEEALYKELTN